MGARLAFPKPEPRKRTKARKARHESMVIALVRAACVDRDGYCRINRIYQRSVFAGRRSHMLLNLIHIFGECSGPSEWCHYNDTHRRSKTMRMAAEYRHDAAHSLMLCHAHSQAYDQHRMEIEELDGAGCNGRLRFTRCGEGFEEP